MGLKGRQTPVMVGMTNRRRRGSEDEVEMSPSMPRQPEPEFMSDPAEAEAYAEADFADVNHAFVERLLEQADLPERAVALDLGTGPGDIPIRLVHERPGWRVAGVDASSSMLGHAQPAAGRAGRTGSIAFGLADAKVLPFRSQAFEVILSNSILHHITEVDRFWTELLRVGKPGAPVLLRDLARPAGPEAARQIVQQYAEHESALLRAEFYRSLLSAYTPREVRTQLDRAGLAGLQVGMVSNRHWDVWGRLP